MVFCGKRAADSKIQAQTDLLYQHGNSQNDGDKISQAYLSSDGQQFQRKDAVGAKIGTHDEHC